MLAPSLLGRVQRQEICLSETFLLLGKSCFTNALIYQEAVFSLCPFQHGTYISSLLPSLLALPWEGSRGWRRHLTPAGRRGCLAIFFNAVWEKRSAEGVWGRQSWPATSFSCCKHKGGQVTFNFDIKLEAISVCFLARDLHCPRHR